MRQLSLDPNVLKQHYLLATTAFPQQYCSTVVETVCLSLPINSPAYWPVVTYFARPPRVTVGRCSCMSHHSFAGPDRHEKEGLDQLQWHSCSAQSARRLLFKYLLTATVLWYSRSTRCELICLNPRSAMAALIACLTCFSVKNKLVIATAWSRPSLPCGSGPARLVLPSLAPEEWMLWERSTYEGALTTWKCVLLGERIP